MYGFLALDQKGRGGRVTVRRTDLCGLPVLQVDTPCGGTLLPHGEERRMKRAAALLRKRGATSVLTPSGFPCAPLLEAAGLREVDCSGLCRAVAAPLTLAVLRLRGWEPSRAVVQLSGEAVSAPLFRAAEGLAGQVHRLIVDVPRGGGELASYLHGEYGLPILHPGTVRPALTVAFDPRPPSGGVVLALSQPRPALLGARLWAEGLDLPAHCDPLSLLAALWESGMLPERRLRAGPEGNYP